jgi:UvrD/REP helicase N-terminal domain/UvrD-like helicase C-terminal domain/LAGLIDADG-like domain
MKPTDEQQTVIEALDKHQRISVEAYAGCGKALRADQPVLTPDRGYVPIGQLQVGELVVGSDGLPCPVTGVYPQGEVELARLTVTGDTEIVTSLDHLWPCQTKYERDQDRGWTVRTTAEIQELLRDPKVRSVWLPMISAPVQGQRADLPVDPWLLGAIIGDGGLTSGSVSFTNSDQRILDEVDRRLPEGVSRQGGSGRRPGEWRLTSGRRVCPGHRGFYNPLIQALRDLGLMGCGSSDKTIDDHYLRAAATQRLALLQGLMDTDGYTSGHGCEWGTTSPKLMEQFSYLVHSLGGVVRVTARPTPGYTYKGETRVGQPYWRLFVRLPGDIAPFAHSAKADRYIPKTKYQPSRQILDLAPERSAEAVCISVAAPDQLFLTADCIPTHNTTVLRLLADANPDQQFFYTAFNKAIVTSSAATMPKNVVSKTTHSMAWPMADRRRIFEMQRQPGWQQAQLLGIGAEMVQVGQKTRRLAGGWLAGMGLRTLSRWCDSGDAEIGAQHVVYPRAVLEDPTGDWASAKLRLRELAIDIAQQAWGDVSSSQGRLKWEHGYYLKMYQLAGWTPPDVDVFMLDEAQDTNGVTLAIMENIVKAGAQVVLVGDKFQEIYAWRGATNAMERGEVDETCYLTGSWRFGSALAEVANLVLVDTLGAKLPLRGMNPEPGVVGPAGKVDAILGRTNAAVMAEAMELQKQGLRVFVQGGTADMARFVRAAMSLMSGKQVEHPDLGIFENWSQVQDYTENDPGGEDLAVLVRMIDDPAIGPQRLLAMLDGMTPKKPDIVLSTGHKAKGLEWPTVRLLSDFKGPQLKKVSVASGEQFDNQADVRLLYVGATRAQSHLDTSSVAYLRPRRPEAAASA